MCVEPCNGVVAAAERRADNARRPGHCLRNATDFLAPQKPPAMMKEVQRSAIRRAPGYVILPPGPLCPQGQIHAT